MTYSQCVCFLLKNLCKTQITTKYSPRPGQEVQIWVRQSSFIKTIIANIYQDHCTRHCANNFYNQEFNYFSSQPQWLVLSLQVRKWRLWEPIWFVLGQAVGPKVRRGIRTRLRAWKGIMNSDSLGLCLPVVSWRGSVCGAGGSCETHNPDSRISHKN